jgi:diaminohydroxyphosphoribosylaminopyrimidine deaminase/5-amino-6-(5-phosphoribosylamino)uracil reductase
MEFDRLRVLQVLRLAMNDAGDFVFMARAIELARRGRFTTHPNPRVGCVLVRDGVVVGEGWHERAGEPHAEIHALHAAGERARGATAYVTLEPCSHHGRTPPCAEALVDAGVIRVVGAMEDPDPRVSGRGFARLREAGITVESGLMQRQAEALNQGFIMRHRAGRPFVRSKLAMTMDGRVATARGESRWITSPEARSDVQRLRAQSDAVMTGIGTVLADDPSLNVRAEDLVASGMPPDRAAALPQPLRIIVDARLRAPASARIFRPPGRVLVAMAVAASPDIQSGHIEAVRFAAGQGRVDLEALLGFLAERRINEVLLEAGPTLNGAMLSAGLIDELVLYMAPKLLGDSGRGLFTLPGLDRLDQAIGLQILDVRAVGKDWRVTARIEKAGA